MRAADQARAGGADATVAVARDLKARYLAASASDPGQAAAVAAQLAALDTEVAPPAARALARWTAGMAALQLEGQPERAARLLDEAAALFQDAGDSHQAALTQVAKVAALAMLGRYDEAIESGRRALDVFDAYEDRLAAGKIAQNLGNIHQRRGQYREAARLAQEARSRFLALDDQPQLAQVENNLATALKWQHDFKGAERFYESALARASGAGLEVTEAEIEVNLGVLALFQGRYDRALDFLERARRRYAALEMPHKSALTDLDLADAYLELNLAPEAEAIYARIGGEFERLGLRAEAAWATAQLGRACLVAGRRSEAQAHLERARGMYAAERNAVGVAMVELTQAQLAQAGADYALAGRLAESAEGTLAGAGAWGRLLLARWLRGESARRLGHHDLARALLEQTLEDASARVVPPVLLRCHTSLGLLAAARGDAPAAEAALRRAVDLVETLRAPLPAEEFRTAYLADNLLPFAELTRLCLASGTPERAAEALGYVERARSRALLDVLAGALPTLPVASDGAAAALQERLGALGAELSWYYSQLERVPGGGDAPAPDSLAGLQRAVQEREAEMLEVSRQLRQRGAPGSRVEPFSLPPLQAALGAETVLVEYFALDGELLAFVVTADGVSVVRPLAPEGAVEEAVRQLRFQIDSLRHGAGRLRPHLEQLAARARHHLGALYDLLLRPLEPYLGRRRLVVVPHRALHYVPFHALHDGERYVLEGREVAYAPSAGVLLHCLRRPTGPPRRAAVLGVPGAQAPRVRDEVAAVVPHFPEGVALLDGEATLDALRRAAPGADVLHLACHGRFRPDNPLFSSLRLSGGWLTVRDAYGLDLSASQLVTLSACETGVSAVAPGEELIGLSRAFFAAGAPTLVVSQWTVDDESTARLMADFYSHLVAGERPAAALRRAQLALLEERPHPFYWSPFVVLGRW